MRFENILEWYSGKARDTIAQFVIPALVECEELGCWKKGVSRSVKGALNKQNVAKKWVDTKAWKPHGSPDLVPTHGNLLEKIEVPSKKPRETGTSGWYLAHAMRFGSFELAKSNIALAEKLEHVAEVAPRETYEAWGVALRWAKAFAPIAELVRLLDASRPKQTVVMKTLSPTVMENLSKHVGIDMRSIQSPPMKGEWREETIVVGGKSKQVRVWRVRIEWPEGTLHNRSKFFHSGENWQCQACGHAIRNPFNWVPILAYGDNTLGTKSTPYSLIVGRDCAEKLFGCEVDGDMLIENRDH